MNLTPISLLVFFLCLCYLSEAKKTKNPVNKLHIGIKKRVECTEDSKSKKGDFLHMHYRGTLEDGEEFDSSLERNPFTFRLGSGQVIKGWDQGLIGMCIGEKRKLVIPPELGYGARGAPPRIPGNSVLLFEVELINIERRDEL